MSAVAVGTRILLTVLMLPATSLWLADAANVSDPAVPWDRQKAESFTSEPIADPNRNLSIVSYDDRYLFATQSESGAAGPEARPKLLVHSKLYNRWMEIATISGDRLYKPDIAAFPPGGMRLDSDLIGWGRHVPMPSYLSVPVSVSRYVKVPIPYKDSYVLPTSVRLSEDRKIYILSFVSKPGRPNAGVTLHISVAELNITFDELANRESKQSK